MHRSGLRTSVWEHSEYEDEPLLVSLEDIISPVMLAEAMVCGHKRWVSVFLNHVRSHCHFDPACLLMYCRIGMITRCTLLIYCI
jgi:hypothetical protein